MNRDKYENLSISEIMQSEEAVRALAEDCNMYREALDALPEPVVIHDRDRCVVSGNEAFHRQDAVLAEQGVSMAGGEHRSLEQARDALNASPMAQVMPGIGDIWYERHTAAWARSLELGEPVEREEITGAWLLYGVKETPSGYFVDYRMDISKLKEVQAQLQEILERTNQGVAIFSSDYKILHINPALEELWGLQEFGWREQVKTLDDFFEYSRQAGAVGQNCETEEEWQEILKGATEMALAGDVDSAPVPLDNGRHLQFTSRKLSNGQYLHLHNDVTEVEKQKSSLKKATREAEAAERAKSEFLANMSHEIRTPMNGVMGMAELLLRTDLDSKQHSFANTIVKSGQALLTIINDILDFSKIDAGQMTLEPAPFSFSDAVEDVATLVSSHAADKGLELAVRLPHNLPQTMTGDVGRIRQVITNLVGNAVKFTDEGHVLIDVTCEEVTLDGGEPGVELDVRITDTGVGIPQDKCDLIFEKFSQVDTSAARRHEGTGLGLAITSSLVRLMDGKIGVESVEGEGSTFWIKLKLPAEVKRRELAAPVDVNGARILIVDDNEVNRAILIEQLTSWGFVAKAASSGAEGLQLARASVMLDVPFELAILDYQMPEMTGVELAETMKADAALRSMTNVLLTSVDHVIDRDDLQARGVDAYLTKPARSSLLLETIVEGLQARAASAAEIPVAINPMPAPVLPQAAPASTTPPIAAPASVTKPAPLSDAFAALADQGTSQTATPADETALKAPEPESVAAPSAPVSPVEPIDLTPAEPLAVTTEAEAAASPALASVVEPPAQAEATPAPEAEPVVKSYGAGAPSQVDILVAEDNEINQIVFGQTIKGSTDFTFQIAQNGEEAVELYLKLNPTLILMDVSMPIMNGMEATAAIREHEKVSGRRTPIVGVTAHAIQGDREKCLAGGMDDYLSKPISPRMLLEKIENWMAEGKRQAS